ncbi:MAG: HPF/RaiA family ribosome-associated protein [Phycisphaeraceae bacterium]|nr:HPF/RaiA family ribosome-associated protein [Phycisphaeraceae bacterium]
MNLHVEIGYQGTDRSEALDTHVRSELDAAVGRFSDRLSRVEVHIADQNSRKSGPADKRCLMEARPLSMDPLVAEHEGEDLYDVVRQTARKLERVLERRLAKD